MFVARICNKKDAGALRSQCWRNCAAIGAVLFFVSCGPDDPSVASEPSVASDPSVASAGKKLRRGIVVQMPTLTKSTFFEARTPSITHLARIPATAACADRASTCLML